MRNWLFTIKQTIKRSEPSVLVTIAQARGSVPREAGTKLLVTSSTVEGTIGGGNLEFRAIAKARELLGSSQFMRKTERVPLGPSLGQCCGGDVVLLYERLTSSDLEWIEQSQSILESGNTGLLITRVTAQDEAKSTLSDDQYDKRLSEHLNNNRAVKTLLSGRSCTSFIKSPALDGGPLLLERLADDRNPLVLFGAGHVGRALIEILNGLPFRVTWVDSRPSEFPLHHPPNVAATVSSNPVEEVVNAAPGASFLVMTHSHPLDLALCEAVLRRNDFSYLGLIGSATKKAKFLRQLRDGGIPETDISRLICPIGLPEIAGKEPHTIAVSVAAQLLMHKGPKAGRA